MGKREQSCGEMGEKVKPVVHTTREVMAVRHRQVGGTCTITWAHGDVWLWRLPRAMSGSMALLKLGSVLMSLVMLPPKSIWMSLVWAVA